MNNFALTKAGIIVPATSGSLSFLSSCFILISILRSKQNTPYHRIMFFMSIWDAITSFCYALTTIPMPSDVVYDYAGPSFGTKETCEAQSFILLSAAGLILMSNILLNIYYLCTIRYNIAGIHVHLCMYLDMGICCFKFLHKHQFCESVVSGIWSIARFFQSLNFCLSQDICLQKL